MKRIIPFVIIMILIFLTVFVNSLAGSLLLFLFLLIQLYRMRAVYFTKKGFRAFSEGDMAGAVLWYARAVGTGRASAKAYLSLCLLYEKTGEFDKAGTLLDSLKAQSLNGNYEKRGVETTEAILLWKQGDIEGADRAFQRIINEFQNTTLFGCMVSFYLERMDRAKAFPLARDAYEFNGENSIIRDNYAYSLFLQNRKEEAREIWEKLLDEGCILIEPHYHMAKYFLLEKDDREEARRILDKSRGYFLSRISYLREEELANLRNELVI